MRSARMLFRFFSSSSAPGVGFTSASRSTSRLSVFSSSKRLVPRALVNASCADRKIVRALWLSRTDSALRYHARKEGVTTASRTPITAMTTTISTRVNPRL